MAKETDKARYPYLPFQTFISLLDRLKEQGVPARIDRGWLSYTSGINQTYLLATLRAFDLIDEQNGAKPALRDLVKDVEGRPAMMADIIQRAYPKQMELPSNATAQQLEETFSSLQGETKRKAVTFFLHAAKFAELTLSPHFKAPRPAKSGGGTKRARKPKDSQEDKRGTPETPDPPPSPIGMTRNLELKSGGTLTVSLTANIWDLSEEDEQFVMGLVKTMRAYGDGKSKSGGQI